MALGFVREAFTLKVTVKDHKEIYTELASRFRPAFKDVGRGGAFAGIIRGKDFGVMEVPSWAWHRKVGDIQEYLSGVVEETDPFVLALSA